MYDFSRRNWLWFGLTLGCLAFYIGAEIIETRRRRAEWDSLEKLLRSGKYLSPLPSSFRRGKLTPEKIQQYMNLLLQYPPVSKVAVVFGEPLVSEPREEPVIGYRAWHIRDDRLELHSVAVHYTWSFEVNRARCMTSDLKTRHYGHDGKAPNSLCECGLYVQATPEQAMRTTAAYSMMRSPGILNAVVVGAVMGWGKVCQHGVQGWRAEYARAIALYGEPTSWAARIAKEAGLPCFDNIDGLRFYAEEYGKALPGQGVKKKV